MRGCRACRSLIAEAVTGGLDAGARETLDLHLARCPKCARLHAGLAATVRKFEVRPAPDPPEEFWEGYWARLERRMAAEAGKSPADRAVAPSRPRRAGFVPRWAYGAAGAAIMLAAGIFIGREIGRRTELPGVAASAVSPAEETLAMRAAHHLKRSRMLILAVVNSDPGAGDSFGLNLPLQKKASSALKVEAAALKKEIGGADRRLERCGKPGIRTAGRIHHVAGEHEHRGDRERRGHGRVRAGQAGGEQAAEFPGVHVGWGLEDVPGSGRVLQCVDLALQADDLGLERGHPVGQ